MLANKRQGGKDSHRTHHHEVSWLSPATLLLSTDRRDALRLQCTLDPRQHDLLVDEPRVEEDGVLGPDHAVEIKLLRLGAEEGEHLRVREHGRGLVRGPREHALALCSLDQRLQVLGHEPVVNVQPQCCANFV